MGDCTTKHEKFEEVEEQLRDVPSGVLFEDGDGDLCIYLGTGGKRDSRPLPLMLGDRAVGSVYELEFQPVQHVFACRYENSWLLSSFENNPHEMDNLMKRWCELAGTRT